MNVFTVYSGTKLIVPGKGIAEKELFSELRRKEARIKTPLSSEIPDEWCVLRKNKGRAAYWTIMS